MSIEQHGWTKIHIELTDVSFRSWLELGSRDGEGKWSRRSTPLWFITKDQQKEQEAEFEALQGLRYSTPKRFLEGKASLPSFHNRLYLGTFTEDIRSSRDSTPIHTFQCEINQLDKDEECRFGLFEYLDYETLEGVFLSLYLPPSAFELIEQTVCSSDGVLSLICNIKCWHFVYPDASHDYYVDKNSPSPAELAHAELAHISLKEIVSASAIDPDELVDEEGLEEDGPDEPLLLQKIEKIEQNIDSLKLPLWVAAIAAMSAAISLIF